MWFNKGLSGEYALFQKLHRYEERGAKLLFNCYLKKADGSTTEIDVMMISATGVYVFENKNYSGWIFGNATQRTWTQTLPNGKKSHKEHFFNPVWQNATHVATLKQFLGMSIPTHSLIVFSNGCTIKKLEGETNGAAVLKMREVNEFIDLIENNMPAVLNEEQVNTIYQKLRPLTQVSRAKKREHIDQIQKKVQQKPPQQKKKAPTKPIGKPIIRRRMPSFFRKLNTPRKWIRFVSLIIILIACMIFTLKMGLSSCNSGKFSYVPTSTKPSEEETSAPQNIHAEDFKKIVEGLAEIENRHTAHVEQCIENGYACSDEEYAEWSEEIENDQNKLREFSDMYLAWIEDKSDKGNYWDISSMVSDYKMLVIDASTAYSFANSQMSAKTACDSFFNQLPRYHSTVERANSCGVHYKFRQTKSGITFIEE